MPYTEDTETSIYYETYGDGDELIVLVPGLGLTIESWQPVTELLAGRFRVVVLDPRGSGKSERSGTNVYSGETVARDVRNVMDAVGEGSCHIVGVSMGGMIAQDFMLRYPSRVKSAILFSTSARPDEWFTRLFETRRELIQRVGFYEHFKLFQMFIFSPFSYRDYPERVRAVQASVARNPPDESGYLRQIDYCLNHDVLDDLSKLSLRSLVVSGSGDTLTPPYLGEDIAKVLPESKYVEVEGASHGLVFERPGQVASVIDSFVSTGKYNFDFEG
ncbi:alpha/beta fold hydrolase [Sphingobium fuliginis]|uniref:Alpha/beta fold hydrolase n=1 Tax=Sphingobium fuliginis ATCC 27551 TaxID=1208342 RepID=A0A5B8CP07_SPHSA|nr:alpha/beta hydrolase [Sphingobium fuliginis]QDC40422.1 alpha/beta fold hydrolase [Sphingobium fuliginis ATCC 27551]